MLKAVRSVARRVRDLGILLVIGEEVDGRGAHFANQSPPEGVR
ncbi:MAG: hypothetical protein R2748_19825 [Bryobacterales bacterium]